MREREKEEDMNSGYEMSKEVEEEKILRCISHISPRSGKKSDS